MSAPWMTNVREPQTFVGLTLEGGPLHGKFCSWRPGLSLLWHEARPGPSGNYEWRHILYARSRSHPHVAKYTGATAWLRIGRAEQPLDVWKRELPLYDIGMDPAELGGDRTTLVCHGMVEDPPHDFTTGFPYLDAAIERAPSLRPETLRQREYPGSVESFKVSDEIARARAAAERRWKAYREGRPTGEVR